MTTDLPMTCPSCGRMQERHTSMLDRDPQPTLGSASLCISCLGFSIFDEDPEGKLYRRRPTNAEFADLLANESVQRVYAATSLAWRREWAVKRTQSS